MFKRLLGLALASVMILSSVPAFADEMPPVELLEMTEETEAVDALSQETEQMDTEASVVEESETVAEVVESEILGPEVSESEVLESEVAETEAVVAETIKETEEASDAPELFAGAPVDYVGDHYGGVNWTFYYHTTGKYLPGDLVITPAKSPLDGCVTGQMRPYKLTMLPQYITDVGYEYTIKRIIVEEGVTTISGFAFQDLSPESISLPSSLRKLEKSAFQKFNYRNSLELPEGLETIESSAFSMSGMTSVVIPESVKSIGRNIFARCDNLVSVTFMNPMTELPEAPFIDTPKLASVYFPESVTEIRPNFFNDCGLTTYIVPNHITKIGESAFSYASKLKTVVCPESVKTIGPQAFMGCSSLTSVKLPASLDCIGTRAFKECTSLKTIAFPAKLQKIGKEAFIGCTALESISFPDNVGEFIEGEYRYIADEGKVWFPDQFTAGKIPELVCSGCSNLNFVSIGNKVTLIGKDAFSGIESIARSEYRGTKSQYRLMTWETGNDALYRAPVTYSGNYNISSFTAALSYAAATYSGSAKKPTATVKNGTVTLKSGVDYSITYQNNIKIGTATAVIKGKGNYTGSITKTFKIVPKPVSWVSLTACVGGFTAKWNKATSYATGYQVQYARDAAFKTDKVTKTISSKSTVSKKITSLVSGKTYYVRIRTYYTVDGTKYYSKWSSIKSAKTK